jgi:hypothetical protein
MNWKRTATGTAAYTLVTFPLAVVWHVLMFEEQYRRFGYFDGEPSFALGLLTIVIQGLLLSAMYPRFRTAGPAIVRGLTFAAVIGAFFWTSHVLAFIAKQTLQSPSLFVVMETFYLLLQFGIFVVLIGLVYRSESREAQ